MAQADSYPATGNGARAQDMAQGGARRKTWRKAAQGGARRKQWRKQAKPSQARRTQGRKTWRKGARKPSQGKAQDGHEKGHAIYGVAFDLNVI